jgi:hypothetical protein
MIIFFWRAAVRTFLQVIAKREAKPLSVMFPGETQL